MLAIGHIIGLVNSEVNKLLYLEFLRKERGLSQADLAKECRIDRSYVCRAEKHGFCYDRHLGLMADALGFDGDKSQLLKEVVVHVGD